jgi:protein-tyrosine-phosphatase
MPEHDPAEPFTILFVCTGNTCRSPLAAAIARREIERRGWAHVRVESAGVAARAGDAASAHARTVGLRAGADVEAHRSQPLSEALVGRADLVLAMGPGHLEGVRRMGGEAKARTLGDFVAGGEGLGPAVPDPFGGPEEAYEETFRELAELIDAALDRLAPLLHP